MKTTINTNHVVVVVPVGFHFLLAILDPSHIGSTFTECLSFHINTIFTNKSHPTFPSRVLTGSGALAIIFGMGGI